MVCYGLEIVLYWAEMVYNLFWWYDVVLVIPINDLETVWYRLEFVWYGFEMD